MKRKSVPENTSESWDHLLAIRQRELQIVTLKNELRQMTAPSSRHGKTVFLTDSPIRLVQGGAPGLKK
jgi:hypothetical protein